MPRTTSEPQQWSATALQIFALIGLAVAISVVIGYVALMFLPCSWFGSPFEGACGYGAVLFVMAVGTILAALLSVAFVVAYFMLRGRHASSPLAVIASIERDTALHWFQQTFWIFLLSYIAIYFLPPPINSYVLSLPLLIIHCVFVFMVARLLKKQPIIWTLVAALLAPIGTAVAFWYFSRIRKIAPTSVLPARE